MENYIIITPLAEVFINGISQGFHNELTCRNLQVAVKRKELHNVKFIFNNEEFIVDENGKLNKQIKGFYDISYEIVKKLMF